MFRFLYSCFLIPSSRSPGSLRTYLPVRAPPPAQSAAGQQVFLPAQPVLNSMVQPRQSKRASSVVRKILSVVGKFLSIIGMVIGGFSILFGIFGFFAGGDGSKGIVIGLWLGGLFIFFGLMIFFIALIRKTSLPISRARKTKATIGRSLAILGIIFGVILTILGVIYINTNAAGAIAIGPVVCGEAAVIWWVTRIKLKKTPEGVGQKRDGSIDLLLPHCCR